MFHRPSSALAGTFSPREKVFLRFAKHWILQLRAGMPFVQNDKKEAFESWFSDVIKPGFRNPLKMPSFYAEPKGGVAESNAEDS